MRRREFCRLAGGAAAACSISSSAYIKASAQTARSHRLVYDMLHITPGASAPKTAFLNPRALAAWSYNGQVILSLIEGVPTFDALSPDLISVGSRERIWSDRIANNIRNQINAAHASGLKCLAWMQLIVFPIPIVQAYKSDICDNQGRIDPALPMTQKLLRIQLAEIFERFPDLDGLVIRTGEVYLYDLPFHASTSALKQEKMQGSSAILHGADSHLILLRTLREEVCVAHNRSVSYRTWDFGNNFHTNPSYYLSVTNRIPPHPKLVFSVKQGRD
jgi:hypothetical protein